MRIIRKTVLLAVGFFALIALVLVVDGLTDSAEASDVVVVLGNEVRADGSPSARLAARLDAAVGIYEAGLADAVIVRGAVGKSGHDEAVVMADYLVAEGIPSAVIIIASEGATTRATAVNSAAVMNERGWTSAIVATQYFHVARSRLAFEQEGVDRVTTVHADLVELRDVYSVAREVPAYARYFLG
ncbi:MAG: YdcF family protein [Actinomycetia bacterium]|nr:YdcF family protein [Actinomycetes bacterium]